jgi:hypothetical protein
LVIEDAAILRQQQRRALLALPQPGDIGGQHRLERRDDVRALFRAEQQLAHVADVEQPGRFAHPQMLGHDAFILDGHFVARERDHPATACTMPRIERQLLDRNLVGFGLVWVEVAHVGLPQEVNGAPWRRNAVMCRPLCHGT